MASSVERLLANTSTLEAEPPPIYDNFYSPENGDFYAQKPYRSLEPAQHQIRFLKFDSYDLDGTMCFLLVALSASFLEASW